MPATNIGRLIKLTTAVLSLLAAASLMGCGLAMSNEDRLDRAEQEIADGDFRAAIIDAKDVLQDEPDNVRGRVLLAKASLRVDDFGSAEKEFRRAIELGTDLAVVAVDLGETLLGLGQYQKVIDEITTDSARSEEEAQSILQIRGQALLGAGQPSAARDVFAQVLQTDAGNIAAQLGIVSSHVAEKNFLQARATLDMVLASSENAIEPWLLSAQMYLEVRDMDSAEAHFSRALDLAVDQDNREAQASAMASLGELLLAKGNEDRAREFADKLMVLAPGLPASMLLSAHLAYVDRDWQTAQSQLQELLRMAPNYRPAQFLLGAVHLQNGNIEQAEMYLSAVVAAVPANVDARNLLAQARLQKRDARSAQDLLQPLVDQASASADSLMLAAQASASVGDLNEAIQYLERRAQAAGGDPQSRLDLATMYLMVGRDDEARAILEDLENSTEAASGFRRDMLSIISLVRSGDLAAALSEAEVSADKWSDNARAMVMKASVELQAGKQEDARISLLSATKINPQDPLPLRLLGALEEERGNYPAAIDAFAQLIELEPADTGALVALARLSTRSNNLEDARHWLQRSVAEDPENAYFRKLLIETLLALEDFASAQAQAEEAIGSFPDDAEFLNLLGRVQLSADQPISAEESLKKAIRLDSEVSAYWAELARAQIAKGDGVEATRTLDDAGARFPEDELIATLKLQALILSDDFDAALEFARLFRRANPESAIAAALEAEALARSGDLADAADVYDEVLALDSTPRYAARASQLRRAAGLPLVVEPLLAHLDRNPLNTGIRVLLAQNYQQDGLVDEAIIEYEKVLKVAPDNPVALNNLAWIYQEKGDKRAEDYARKAYSIASEDGNVVDTLGWILVQNGNVEEGMELLRIAIQLTPDNPEYQYHFAAALAKQGQVERARTILEETLRNAGDFAGRDAAEELLLRL